MSVTYGTARVPCIIQYALRLYSAIFAPQHPQKNKAVLHFGAAYRTLPGRLSPASFAGSGSRSGAALRTEPQAFLIQGPGRRDRPPWIPGPDQVSFPVRAAVSPVLFLFSSGGRASSLSALFPFRVIFPFYPLDLSLCLLNRLIMCGGGSAEILDFCVDGFLLQIFIIKSPILFSSSAAAFFSEEIFALSFVISNGVVCPVPDIFCDITNLV